MLSADIIFTLLHSPAFNQIYPATQDFFKASLHLHQIEQAPPRFFREADQHINITVSAIIIPQN